MLVPVHDYSVMSIVNKNKYIPYQTLNLDNDHRYISAKENNKMFNIKLINYQGINKNNFEFLIKQTKVSLWLERWFWSSNAKDIGTTYLIYAFLSGLVGTAFSVLIRLELSRPGVQFIADNQLYNSIITAHAIVMIFFMVKSTKIYMLNIKSYLLTDKKIPKNKDIVDNNFDVKIVGNNNSNFKNNSYDEDKEPYKFIKILVENPYNNRDLILKMTKKQKGVYVWKTRDGKNMYVGHSINLYNRISSYFLPSILKTKTRRVLRYLNKYGFENIDLIIYIMNPESSLEKIIALEQYFINKLKPALNVDLVASGSGYYEPMRQEMKDMLRKQRGISLYLYDYSASTLLFVFGSKQHAYDSINIHHSTLNSCLDLGTLYLDNFFFSIDLVEDATSSVLTIQEVNTLIKTKREKHKLKHPAAKSILAEFKDDANKNLEFNSLNELAKHLKGDRQVIRSYLKGSKLGYYRGKWRFSYNS